MRLTFSLLALASAATLAVAATAPTKAVALLRPTDGQKAEGKVTFTKSDAGVKVTVHVSGLTPGKHGFHIHEFGDCSAPDAISAGGHFNPGKHSHGGPEAKERHSGDLGNVTADATGKAHYDRLDERLSFEGPHKIIGRGVIVHEKVDDLKTQPTGNAGARVACGAIALAKP